MPKENLQIRSKLSPAAIGAVAGAGIVLFLPPLIFGGWIVPGFPAYPKALSQFRNPALGLLGVAVLLALFRVLRPATIAAAVSRLDPERFVPPLLGIYGIAFLKAAFLDYAGFSINAIDFSMYDHAMANTLVHRFMQTVTGVNHFGVHATPILFLLLPLHALFHSPYFAIFIHPLALWAGALALDSLVRREGIRDWARIGILFSYLNSVLVSRTLHYGFHVEVFYPLFGFLLLSAIKKGKALSILGALVFFLSVKEDAPFYAIGIFAAAAATRRLPKKLAGVFALFAGLVSVYYLRVLIPANSGRGAYAFVGAAAGFGETPSAALAGALREPARLIRNFFVGGWWGVLLPSFGLLVLSPFFWIASVPFFGIYSLAGSPLMAGLSLYYGMPLVPLFFYGWIDGLKNEVLPKRGTFSLIAAVLGGCLIGGGYLVFRKADLERWRMIAPIAMEIAREEVELPEFAGRPICAPGVLIPHLGYPKGLKLLDPDCIRDADRIVIFDSGARIESPLSTYPLEPAVNDEIVRKIQAWPVVMTSGEFSLRRRPDIDTH